MILGVGPDGHCLSVFPGSAASDADPRVTVLAVEAPTHIAPHLPRVTINPALLEVAGEVLVAAFGSGKASVMAELLGPVRDPRALPAQRARRAGATWILDRAAAAQLPAGVRDVGSAGTGG